MILQLITVIMRMFSSEDLRSTATNALMHLLKDHTKKNGKVLQPFLI